MPLEGGTRLEITLKAMARKWASASVEAGFFEQEPATVAWWNEYGVPDKNIPPRPFMRLSVAEGGSAWVKGLVERLRSGASSREIMDQAGREMQQEIILKLHMPGAYQPNAPDTVRKKGFDAPLIETGQVLTPAVRYKVRMGPRGGEE